MKENLKMAEKFPEEQTHSLSEVIGEQIAGKDINLELIKDYLNTLFKNKEIITKEKSANNKIIMLNNSIILGLEKDYMEENSIDQTIINQMEFCSRLIKNYELNQIFFDSAISEIDETITYLQKRFEILTQESQELIDIVDQRSQNQFSFFTKYFLRSAKIVPESYKEKYEGIIPTEEFHTILSSYTPNCITSLFYGNLCLGSSYDVENCHSNLDLDNT